MTISARVRLVVASALGCVGLLTTGAAIGQAAQKQTASQLLAAALTGASARGSVHELESTAAGSDWVRFADDVALRSGRQHITRSDGVNAHILLAGPAAYISGNQKTLVTYFGYPKSVARRIGTRWVRIPSSDRFYATVTADMTLSSALSEIKPSGRLVELRPQVLDGRSVIGIRGNLPAGFKGTGTDTIYLTRSSHPLLVSAVLAGQGHEVTATFTDWGEHVATNPPARSILNSQL